MARLRRRDPARSDAACPDLLRPGTLIDVQWWLLNGGVPDSDRETLERIRPAVEWFTETQPARYAEWLEAHGLTTEAATDPEYRGLFPEPVARMTLQRFAALVDAGEFDT